MKTNEFSQTEFAKWFFEQVQTIEHYPFDAFYDCHKIIAEMREKYESNEKHERPKNDCNEMFYAVSYMGTHIYDVNAENNGCIVQIVNNRYEGHRFFILKFYFNYSYHHGQKFATVTECDADEIISLVG